MERSLKSQDTTASSARIRSPFMLQQFHLTNNSEECAVLFSRYEEITRVLFILGLSDYEIDNTIMSAVDDTWASYHNIHRS